MMAFVERTSAFWFSLSLFLSSIELTLMVLDCVQLDLYEHLRCLWNTANFCDVPFIAIYVYGYVCTSSLRVQVQFTVRIRLVY